MCFINKASSAINLTVHHISAEISSLLHERPVRWTSKFCAHYKAPYQTQSLLPLIRHAGTDVRADYHQTLGAEIQIETLGKDGREMRRDEISRARNAEREEGLREHCAEEEEKIMAGLVTLARARFE